MTKKKYPPTSKPAPEPAPPTPTKGQQYMPAGELWSRVLVQLRSQSAITGAQIDSFLRPCRLAIMELPTGQTLAAAVQTRTTFAEQVIRARWSADIRACLHQLTGKQVILFVRNSRPPTMPPAA